MMTNRIFPHFPEDLPSWHAGGFSAGDEIWTADDAGEWIVRDRPMLHRLNTPATVFVPEYYEASYPYPLLVRLSRGRSSAEDFHDWMGTVSTRNVLGLDVRCDGLWNADPVRDVVQRAVRELRQTWHIHTERITLVGLDDCGRLALTTLLSRPEWFGGAVSVNGRCARRLSIPFRNPELRGKRILLVSSGRTPGTALRAPLRVGRLLSAAGLQVSTRHYDVDRIEDSTAASDLNAWMVESTCVPA